MLRPARCLVRDKTAGRSRELDCTVGGCSSGMLRAYHPISGLVASRRISSVWYAVATKSETSVSMG